MKVMVPRPRAKLQDVSVFPANARGLVRGNDGLDGAVADGGNPVALGFDISEPLGFGEALIIASTEPLRGFIDVIKTLANTRGIGDQRSPIPDITGDEFLDLTNSLLDDLDRSTRGTTGNENTQLPPDTRGSDATKLAVMSIPFEVVA